MKSLNAVVVTGLVASSFAVVSLWSSPAAACGGFFCENNIPVDQTAERILFIQVDENTVEAHVQISYTGPSENFSWVVPVPGNPEIGIGSDAVFQELEQATSPQVVYQFRTEGECAWDEFGDADGDGASEDASDTAPAGTDGGGVVVLQQDQVGPFDFVIVSAESLDPMVSWLRNNGYDVPPMTEPLLSPYLMDGMNFLAMRLTKDADAGDLQPITMRMESTAPMIPIQLTAIAAEPELLIQVWILASSYAMPANYRIAEVNPIRKAMALRFTQASGAGAVPAAQQLYVDAQRETDTHAFIREEATETTRFRDAFYTDNRWRPEQILGSTTAIQLLQRLNGGFYTGGDALLTGILRTCMPMPDHLVEQGVAPEDFYGSWWVWEDEYSDLPFSAELCVELIEERILEPRRHIQELFDDLTHLSRFATFLDPEDMTIDPMFCYPPNVAPQERTLTATETTLCLNTNLDPRTAPRALDIDGQRYFFGWTPDDNDDRLAFPGDDLPALLRSWQVDCENGNLEPVVDNAGIFAAEAEARSTWFETHWRDQIGENFDDDFLETPPAIPGADGSSDSLVEDITDQPRSSSCAAKGNAPAGGALLAFLLGGLVMLRRRRTSPPAP